jgi:hypothetical protein
LLISPWSLGLHHVAVGSCNWNDDPNQPAGTRCGGKQRRVITGVKVPQQRRLNIPLARPHSSPDPYSRYVPRSVLIRQARYGQLRFDRHSMRPWRVGAPTRPYSSCARILPSDLLPDLIGLDLQDFLSGESQEPIENERRLWSIREIPTLDAIIMCGKID